MFQAIITKWIGPTNTRGSKIKARCAGGTVPAITHDSATTSRSTKGRTGDANSLH